MNIFDNAYPATYQTLYQAEPITCSVTGTTFDAVPAPCAAILDVCVQSKMVPAADVCFLPPAQYFSHSQVYAIRAISGHSVPIIACISAGAGSIIRLYGPESMGGVGDFGARIDAEAARTGLSVDDIGNDVL